MRSAVAHGFSALRLKYAGGEASLNASVLFALHDHARRRCEEAGLTLSAVLLSNGVAISDGLARELVARQIAVMVSLDGIGAAHDAQRPTLNGRPSFAMVQRSLGRLRAAGAAPHLSITITGRNVADVAPVVRFALERELTFSFNFFRDNACSAGVADLGYEEQAMIDGLRAAFAVVEEMLPPWSVLGSVLDRGQLLQPRQKSCGVGDDYVVIDEHGRIAQCHMELGSTLGDVRRVDPVAPCVPTAHLSATCSWTTRPAAATAPGGTGARAGARWRPSPPPAASTSDRPTAASTRRFTPRRCGWRGCGCAHARVQLGLSSEITLLANGRRKGAPSEPDFQPDDAPVGVGVPLRDVVRTTRGRNRTTAPTRRRRATVGRGRCAPIAG